VPCPSFFLSDIEVVRSVFLVELVSKKIRLNKVASEEKREKNLTEK
jgi:hypothetical protein